MSSTPKSSPSLLTIGSTISDFDSESQDICPGNLSTSGTTIVSFLLRLFRKLPCLFQLLYMLLYPETDRDIISLYRKDKTLPSLFY